MSLSGESNHCIEVAIERGRRIEAFVTDPEKKDAVQDRMSKSFLQAFTDGKFKVIDVG